MEIEDVYRVEEHKITIEPNYDSNISSITHKDREDDCKSRELVSKATHKMKQRRAYSFSLSNLLYALFVCFPCRRLRAARAQERQRALYAAGVRKFSAELDCVAILHALRQLRAVALSLLGGRQRALTRFHRDSVLGGGGSWEALLRAVSEDMHKVKVEKLPGAKAGEAEVQAYEDAVEEFMQKYTTKELSKQDLNLLKNII